MNAPLPTTQKPSEVAEPLWPEPPDRWSLGQELHVWSVLLEQPKTRREALAATLSANEARRAAQFRFENIRERWTVGRGLLREILSAYAECHPSELAFQYGAKGKPAISKHPFHFNFSHSGDLALCAVCASEPVGVDVERVCFMAEAVSIAKRCFSPDEQQEFHHALIGEKQRTFYRIWTRKEATLKWNGRGIGDLDEDSLAHKTAFDGFRLELSPANSYIGCLAVQNAPKAVRLWQWS